MLILKLYSKYNQTKPPSLMYKSVSLNILEMKHLFTSLAYKNRSCMHHFTPFNTVQYVAKID